MRIADWEKFQGYKRRGPDWIKLHLGLLDQPQYLLLPVVARAVLPALWLTAARTSETGELPDDVLILAVLTHLHADELRQALPSLVAAGFVLSDKFVADIATEVSGEERREEREREQSVAAPAALAVVSPQRKQSASWTGQACDDWIATYQGTAPGGQIGKALKPLVNAHGWEPVRKAWQAYLAQTEPEYASPQRFAATYGRWSGTAPPARKATVQDRTEANLLAWIESEEGKRGA